MPAYARKDIVREGEVATYHCWSRCVQQAFLCGYDPETGRDFNYRRGWIEDLLAYQAGIFALDVGNFNVLSNHAHTILRTRPDIAATWSADELALRWKMAWPEFRSGQWIREPTDAEIDALLGLPEKLEQIRRNLSSLSWFMARWKEPIAKLCNGEMDRTGHFWEARFGSRELLDEAAVLTCSIYVDLNQIRAGMADSPEASEHSAIRSRILAAKRREAQASREVFEGQDSAGLYAFSVADAEALFEDCWLAPITADGPLLTAASLQATAPQSSPTPDVLPPTADHAAVVDDTPVVEETDAAYGPLTSDHQEIRRQVPAEDTSPSPSPSHRLTRKRASDSPIIDVPWLEYLRVLDAVATITRASLHSPVVAGTVVGPDAGLEEILTRWGMNAPAWLAEFQQLDSRCSRVLGAARQVVRRAGEVAQRWFQGLGWCREIFVDAPSDTFT